MKKTYEQALDWVNSQERTTTIREYNELDDIKKQESATALLTETGWTLDEFVREELKHFSNLGK